MIKLKLTCGSGQSRADDQELGLTFGKPPLLPQPHHFRGRKKKK